MFFIKPNGGHNLFLVLTALGNLKAAALMARRLLAVQAHQAALALPALLQAVLALLQAVHLVVTAVTINTLRARRTALAKKSTMLARLSPVILLAGVLLPPLGLTHLVKARTGRTLGAPTVFALAPLQARRLALAARLPAVQVQAVLAHQVALAALQAVQALRV